jgi:PKD domain-containing protein
VSVSPAPPGNTPLVATATGVPTSGTAPLLVNFSGATSTDANGDSLTFAWTFGDGGTATGRLTSHSYAVAGSYGAILTVNDGHGGTDTASVAISVSTPPTGFPQTAVLDNFNRANGAIGANWIDQPTRFSIVSNTLAPGTGDAYIEWNGASFGPNQEAFVTLSTVNAASQEHNLMLKTQGTTWTGGHIEVSYLGTASQVTVYTFAPPNTWATWGVFSGVTFAAGNQFGARALSDGTVQVYKNGAAIGTVSVAGWPFAGLGGRIGLSVWNASATRFDNFGGGNVAGSLATSNPQLPLAGRIAPPEALSLSAAYPNPTTGAVTMSLTLPRDQDVSLSVLDIQGREVWRTPAEHYTAGRWSVSWDGRSNRGPVKTGVYLANIQVGEKVFLRRFAIVR